MLVRQIVTYHPFDKTVKKIQESWDGLLEPKDEGSVFKADQGSLRFTIKTLSRSDYDAVTIEAAGNTPAGIEGEAFSTAYRLAMAYAAYRKGCLSITRVVPDSEEAESLPVEDVPSLWRAWVGRQILAASVEVSVDGPFGQ